MIRLDGNTIRISTLSSRLVGLLDACFALIVFVVILIEVSGAVVGCGEISVLLGFNIKDYSIYYDADKNKTIECDEEVLQTKNITDLRLEKFHDFMIGCYLFSLYHGGSSALLISATVELKWWKTVPWYISKISSIIVGIYGCVNYYTYIKPNQHDYDTVITIIVMSFLSLISVTHALTEWPAMKRSRNSYSRLEGQDEQSRAEEGANPPRRPSEQQPLLAAGTSSRDPASLDEDDDVLRQSAPSRLEFRQDSDDSGEATDGSESKKKPRHRLRIIAKALSIFLKPKNEEREMETFVENI